MAWTRGAAGGSSQRPMERGINCVERNGGERAKVASVAERKPPQAGGPSADGGKSSPIPRTVRWRYHKESTWGIRAPGGRSWRTLRERNGRGSGSGDSSRRVRSPFSPWSFSSTSKDTNRGSSPLRRRPSDRRPFACRPPRHSAGRRDPPRGADARRPEDPSPPGVETKKEISCRGIESDMLPPGSKRKKIIPGRIEKVRRRKK